MTRARLLQARTQTRGLLLLVTDPNMRDQRVGLREIVAAKLVQFAQNVAVGDLDEVGLVGVHVFGDDVVVETALQKGGRVGGELREVGGN